MGTKLSLTEINKQLNKKELDDQLKQSLKDKQDILLKNKTVEK